MRIKTKLIERLLESNEGVALDFKREQYDFEGASKEKKSELLKDVLAFANTPRQDAAYILIGVEERRGMRSEVVGVSAHLDDAKLQQFVNHKTVRPVTFCYLEARHDGLRIGVLRIPEHQQRPNYAMSDYGRVKKNAVYIRHGSSTATASPDEIMAMGAATVPLHGGADLGGATADSDDHEAFWKAPGSGKLAAKVIVQSKDVDLRGCVLTLDALHASRDTARGIVQTHGADYVLSIKEN